MGRFLSLVPAVAFAAGSYVVWRMETRQLQRNEQEASQYRALRAITELDRPPKATQ